MTDERVPQSITSGKRRPQPARDTEIFCGLVERREGEAHCAASQQCDALVQKLLSGTRRIGITHRERRYGLRW